MESTLAVLGAIQPIVKGGIKAYEIWNEAKAFGEDYRKLAMKLKGQIACVQKIEYLINRRKRCIVDETAEELCTVLKTKFEDCYVLMEKYRPKPPKALLEPSPRANPSVLIQVTPPPQSGGSGRTTPTSSAADHRSIRGAKKHFLALFHKRSPSGSTVTSTSPSSSQAPSPTEDRSEVSSITSAFGDMHLEDQVSAERQIMKVYQENSTIGQRSKWVLSLEGKKELEEKINDIRDDVNTLESLCILSSLSGDSEFMSTPNQIAENRVSKLTSLRKKWERIHDSLATANSSGEMDFSVKVSSVPEEEFNVEKKESFARDRVTVQIQAQPSAPADGARSHFILMQEPGAAGHEINDIQDIKKSLVPLDPSYPHQFRSIGKIISANGDGGFIHIWQDVLSRWHQSRETLSTALENETFRDDEHLLNRVGLAVLVAHAYATSSFNFRKAPPTFPNATHFVYFDERPSSRTPTLQLSASPEYLQQPADKQATVQHNSASADSYSKSLISRSSTGGFTVEGPENIDSSWLGQPYLHFGFGCPMPTKGTAGKSQGRLNSMNNPVVALGNILYLIGSWQPQPQNESVIDMRKKAWATLAKVDTGAGTKYAEIVRDCLNWQSIDSASANAMLEDVYQRLESYCSQLEKLG